MEPPYKRQRLTPDKNKDVNLQKRRARNDNRLKSIFESIFDKYGKDFDGVGDEIDLRTGEIVVDNGHLLGMESEGDTGGREASSEDLESEYSSDLSYDEHDRKDYDQETIANEFERLGDEIVSSGYERGPQAVYDADIIPQYPAIRPPSKTRQEVLQEQIKGHGSDDDELADKAIEWVTPREARTIAYQKWQLPGEGPTFTDGKLVEEAWRAPPLPDCNTPYQNLHKAVPAMPLIREAIQPEETDISLWTSIKRKSRRFTPPKSFQVAPSSPMLDGFASPEEEKSHCGSRLPGAVRRRLKWTKEEENLLSDLTQNTRLSYKEMEVHFPNRHHKSIASKWKLMVRRSDAAPILINDVCHVSRRSWGPSKADTPSLQNLQSAGNISDQSQLSCFGSHRTPMKSINGRACERDCSSISKSPTSGLQKETQDVRHAPYPLDDSDDKACHNNISGSPPASQLSGIYCNCVSTHTGICSQKNPGLSCSGAALSPPTSLSVLDHDAVRLANECIEKSHEHRQIVIPSELGTKPEQSSKGPQSTSNDSPRTSSEPQVSLFDPFKWPLPAYTGSHSSVVAVDSQPEDRIVNPSIAQNQEVEQPSIGLPTVCGSRKPERRTHGPTEAGYLVQVVIPLTRRSEPSEPIASAGFNVSKRDVGSSFPLNGEEGEESTESSMSRQLHFGAEIPDSQPDFSSPMILEGELAPTVLSSKNLVPATQSQAARFKGQKKPSSGVPSPDFDDELSMIVAHPKRQMKPLTNSPIQPLRLSKSVTPLKFQSYQGPHPKVNKTTIADSFSSNASDVHDCSEDELSFK